MLLKIYETIYFRYASIYYAIIFIVITKKIEILEKKFHELIFVYVQDKTVYGMKRIIIEVTL